MLKKLIQSAILAYAKFKYGTSKKKLINFTQAMHRARYIIVLMPRDKQQFLIAYEILGSLPGKYNITVIASSDFKDYFTSSKYRLITFTQDDVSRFGLPKNNFIGKLRLFRYDIAIDLSFNFDLFNAWLCGKLNAGIKMGFKTKNADLFYDFQLATRTSDLRTAYSGLINSLSIF